jgi:uncharacterized protein YdeI (YjbR/CyaY-like superfamily)
MSTDYEILPFTTQKDWESWLKKNHNIRSGIWIKFAKKASGLATVTYDEALDVALCYGWIDGLARSLDETYYLQKFTPRGPRSMWSKRNKEIVAQLIKEGKMMQAGLEKIEEAKKNGRWDAAYDSPKNMVVPDYFLEALAKDKKALEFYQTLNKTNTYAIAFRLQTAKKPETKERRMKVILEMLRKGEKLY